MSKMFTAINRATGEEWKSEGKHHWLMMYDSGYLAEVYDNGWDGCYIKPMPPSEWNIIYRPALKRKIERFLNKQEKEPA